MLKKPARNQFADIPVEMRAGAQREADMDLLTRLSAGSAIYPAMLLLMGLTTPYYAEHERLFWLIAVLTGIALAIRIAASLLREQLYARGRSALIAPLLVSVALSGGAAGFFLLNVAVNYGFSSWTFTVILMWMAGIASGSTISFTPNLALLLTQLFLLLAPVTAYEFSLGTVHGVSLGLATFVFLGFHVVQGRRLNGVHWKLISSRTVEKERMKELEAAKSAAERAQEKLSYQATHDTLTDVMNHGQILKVFERELERAVRARAPLGILMLDMDYFRQVNEEFGHLGGDEVLRTVAERVRLAVRAYDAVGRYGGEEFLLVLPGCNAEESAASAERIRQAIANQPVLHEESEVRVTASVGVTVFDPRNDTGLRQIIARADRALYQAKKKGKNRVEVD